MIYYTFKDQELVSGFYQSLMYVMFTSIRGENYNKLKKTVLNYYSLKISCYNSVVFAPFP